jgi:hypothetical protein
MRENAFAVNLDVMSKITVSVEILCGQESVPSMQLNVYLANLCHISSSIQASHEIDF